LKKLENPRKDLLLYTSEHYSLDDDFSKLSTMELFEKLDEEFLRDPEDETFDWDNYKKIFPIILSRIHASSRDSINTDLREQIIILTNKINELIGAFVNHRHNKEPTYSEKPVW
jgi:hypothetical protein